MGAHSWPQRIWLTESPLLILILLFVISHFFYQRYFRQTTHCLGAGVIMMSLAFYAIACLPLLHVPTFVIMITALELLILWFYYAVELMQDYVHDEFTMDSLADRLSVGAWVTGTILTALLLHQVERTLHGFIVLLGLVSVVLYLFYLWIMFQWCLMYWRKRFKLQANGLILLVTISTQSLVMLMGELFRDDIPAEYYQIIISLGAILYFVGMLAVVRYLFIARNGLAAVGWWNVNTLIYGAVSITGIAMLETGVFPAWVIDGIGFFVILTFVIVAVVEVSRFILRVQCKGIRAGVLVYHPSQWYRVFSCTAVFAFALSYYNHDFTENVFITWVAHVGVYFITLLIVGQGALALSHVLKQEHSS